MNKFYDDMLKGNQVKELVKALLEKAGYLVYPYGYESAFSDMKKKLNVKDAKNSRTVRRIRSSPDLLVYDEQRKDVMLVEVRMRSAPKETDVKYLKIKWCKEFWNDSIVVVVVPSGNVFYAQKVSELEVKKTYNATKDFHKFEDIFTRVSAKDLSHFRVQALQIMEKGARKT